MEIDKNEVAVIAKTVNEAFEKEIQNLTELQLALVGGGIGSVVVG
jgi:hypothetical protein